MPIENPSRYVSRLASLWIGCRMIDPSGRSSMPPSQVSDLTVAVVHGAEVDRPTAAARLERDQQPPAETVSERVVGVVRGRRKRIVVVDPFEFRLREEVGEAHAGVGVWTQRTTRKCELRAETHPDDVVG